MTPEQTRSFMQGIERLLLAASEGIEVDGKIIKLRAAEFMTGVRLLWMGKESSGYVNFSHDEGMLLCDTAANSTMRYHLLRLRNAGVLTKYSTNGTVRAQANYCTDSQNLVVHERKARGPSTNSRGGSTPDDEYSESSQCTARDRAVGQLLRAAGQRDRAAGQHYNRIFDDYPQETGSMLLLLDQHTSPSVDLSNNKQTVPDEVERVINFTLLKHVGVWQQQAMKLAGIYPLSRIRQAVDYWWQNRKSMGGKFEEHPAIVVNWLQKETELPPLSDAFMRSNLYRDFRTKAEIEADRIIEEEAAQWAAIEQAIDVTETAAIGDEPAGIEPDIDVADIWQQTLQLIRCTLAEGIFNAWFAGTEMQLRGTEFVVTCSRTQAAQLSTRYIAMLKRSLSRVLGQEIQSVKFEVKA